MKEAFLFTSGWIFLGSLGTLLTLMSLPLFALICVSLIGIVASVNGFKGCEMLLMMIIASIFGGMLIPFTAWAWMAPFVPGGFMLSVALDDAFSTKTK